MSGRAPRGTRETRYEYGFRSPKGEIVACSSLHEAQFFAAAGATLMLREVETRVGGWQEIEPLNRRST